MLLARAIVFNLVLYIWTVSVSLVSLPLILAPRPLLWAVGRWWVRGVMTALRLIVGLQYEIRGRENVPDGPAIIAAKHQSAWDTLAGAVLVDRPAYVIKRELAMIPVWGWLIHRAGCIPVDRAGGAQALRRMTAHARERAARGQKIIIFPEGTRTAPRQHRSYHPGVAAIYGALSLPVVPTALNSGLFWPRRSLRQHPGTVTVEFLPPIPPGLERKAFMAELRERIEVATERLVDEAEERFPAVSAPHLGSGPVENAVD